MAIDYRERGSANFTRRENGMIDEPDERLARKLGWFSVALGAAQLLAPAKLSALIGVEPGGLARVTQRSAGLREVTAGAGILTNERPAGWMWARVGGDLMDLAFLGKSMTSADSHKLRLAAATAAVAFVASKDLAAALSLSESSTGMRHATRSVTIRKEPDEVYRFWRDFEKLPQFMVHLESVRITGERTSHWTAKGPAGRLVEWDAETTEDRPGEYIAWRSLPGAEVENEGSVRFARAPRDLGTEVTVNIRYSPPGGPLGQAAAAMFGQEPGQQAGDDLRRFKQVMELGEVVRSEGSPWGTDKGRGLRQHPAQPLAQAEQKLLQ